MSSHRSSVRSVGLTAVLAVTFFAFHVPYGPASLEDLDSINFALGVRHFDVAEHQPHPPGYPVYIFVAKGALRLTSFAQGILSGKWRAMREPSGSPSGEAGASRMMGQVGRVGQAGQVAQVGPEGELAALWAVSIVSATAGVLAIAMLFRRIDPALPVEWSFAATAVAVTAPLYWFTAARPLSDAMGLAASLAIQALALASSSAGGLAAAAFAAGTAAGIRSQVVWLTVPLLVIKGIELTRHKGEFGVAIRAIGAYIAGVLVWAVPLVALTGGPAGYVRALSRQGSEDFSGVRMLLTSPTPRALASALYYTFVAPWASAWLAVAVLVLAAIGCAAFARKNRRTAMLLACAFAPYLVFHIVFQETVTGRYALPLVIPLAFCAVAGARTILGRTGLVVLAAVAMFCAHVGGTSVAAYSREKAPAFRLLDDMHAASVTMTAAAVLAPDRREEFDLRRPIRWVGDAMAAIDRKLAAPPQHEWLELVKYWNAGGRAPVWLIVDPMRNAVDLVGRGNGGAEPRQYRWHLPYPVLLSGVRPNEMDWYRVTRPDWYVGEGWALTPEAAGVSDVDHRGVSTGPIDAWIARETAPGTLVIGGRNLEPAVQPRLEVVVNDRQLDRATLAPGFFLRFIPLDSTGVGAADYAKVTVRTAPPSRTAIEQFDAASWRAVFGYGQGWLEPEFNPRNGLRWRWLSERGELRVHAPAGTSNVTLHLEGESPRTYFSRGSHLTMHAGQQVVFDQVLTTDFAVDAVVPLQQESHGDATITLETDQVFIPAEHSWRPSGDRRHLGLRIFKCVIR